MVVALRQRTPGAWPVGFRQRKRRPGEAKRDFLGTPPKPSLAARAPCVRALFGKFDRTEEIALKNHSASLDYLLNMCRDGAEYRTTATVSVAELTAMHGAGHELPVSGDAYARWIGAGSGNPWRLGPRQ